MACCLKIHYNHTGLIDFDIMNEYGGFIREIVVHLADERFIDTILDKQSVLRILFCLKDYLSLE